MAKNTNFDKPDFDVFSGISLSGSYQHEGEITLDTVTGMGMLPGVNKLAVEENVDIQFDPGIGDEFFKDFLVVDPEYSPVDHSWMTDPYDPGALPHQQKVIPQLEKQWIEGDSPLSHYDQDYQEPVKEMVAVVLAPKQKLARAMRQITAGKTPAPDPEIQEGMDKAAQYKDLAGNVFIWASAYPGCQNGTWGDTVKKTASSARYMIAAKKCGDCTFNKQGQCSVFSKTIVASVPWAEAQEVYAAQVQSRGVVDPNPKTALKLAFQKKAVKVRAESFPQYNPLDYMKAVKASVPELKLPDPTVKQAQRATAVLTQWRTAGLINNAQHAEWSKNPLKGVVAASSYISTIKVHTYDAVQRVVVSSIQSRDDNPTQESAAALERYAAKHQQGALQALGNYARKQDLVSLDPLIRQGRLTKIEASGLLDRGMTPFQIAVQRLSQPSVGTLAKTSMYEGEGVGALTVKVSADEMIETLERIAASQLEVVNALDQYRQLAMAGQFKSAVKRGLVSNQEVEGFIKQGMTHNQVLSIVQARIEKAGELKPLPVHDYAGPLFTASKTPRVAKEAAPKEVAELKQWAVAQMQEGVAGEKLDNMIEEKFSEVVRKAAHKDLMEIRARQEGLAGFLYVDPQVYASPEGSSGCKTGAKIHRASTVPLLLEMKRCADCSFVNKDAEGHSICARYSKELIRGTPKNAQKIALANIRLANKAPKNASVVAPADKTAEQYGLGSISAMDQIDLTPPVVEPRKPIKFSSGWNPDFGGTDA